MKKVYSIAITDKVKECTAYYTKYFGFTIVFEADWYVQLLHEPSGAELGLMAPDVDNQPKQLHPGFSGNGMIYSFEVDDAQSEYERLSKETALDFIVALKDESFGQRHFIVRDPAGIYVDVVQQLTAQ